MTTSMKMYPSLILMLIMFSGTAFIPLADREITFSINIEGIEKLNLKEGITPSELALMHIEVDDQELSVETFEIILARGNRPVSYPKKTIAGNAFDLAEYAAIAKSGDRLVIEIKKVSGLEFNEISGEHKLLSLPIK